MDNGASSYRRFLDGDESGLTDIVNMYGDKLMLFINSFVNNLSLAEEIMEDVFMELVVKFALNFWVVPYWGVIW